MDRLVELASSVDSAGPEETASSSFEYIGRTVTNLAFSVDLYRQALTNQQQSVRDHVFEALLRENFRRGRCRRTARGHTISTVL